MGPGKMIIGLMGEIIWEQMVKVAGLLAGKIGSVVTGAHKIVAHRDVDVGHKNRWQRLRHNASATTHTNLNRNQHRGRD